MAGLVPLPGESNSMQQWGQPVSPFATATMNNQLAAVTTAATTNQK